MKLSDFKNAHKWLIIPLIGFSRGYFFRLTEANWHQHMHGLSAILWYVMMIVQPYLITKENVKKHKYFGILSLFLAGWVIIRPIGRSELWRSIADELFKYQGHLQIKDGAGQMVCFVNT